MSTLKTRDKTILEKAFEMGSGYVLDFSDRTMSDFFEEEFGIEVYNEKYDYDFPSKSKANRMRGIWKHEDNGTVSKIILALIDYAETVALTKGKGITDQQKALFEKAKEIANKISGRQELEPLQTSFPEDKKTFSSPEDVVEAFSEAIATEQEEIKNKKNTILELWKYHTKYIDVLEVFCKNPAQVTFKLDTAYQKLANYIYSLVDKLGIEHHQINFYRPFTDLYSAETEWRGKNAGFSFDWDTIRPQVHTAHSNIIRLVNIATQDNDEDEDILLIANEAINTQKQAIETKSAQKIEMTLKDERKNSKTPYITKKGDDFYHKGKHLDLSKKADYYKVFVSLYDLLDGKSGEVSYGDLIKEIKTRIPSKKNKSDEEMRKFIQQNLTDKNNGFMRYASINGHEDNGKPLLKIARGEGIIFNNG